MAGATKTIQGVIMRTTYFFLVSLSILLISGCAGPSTLTYNQSTFDLRVDNKLLKVHGVEQKSNRENFSILFLEQKLVKLDDGSLVMYEYGETDISYQFAQTTTRTIAEIFDTRKVERVYDKGLIFGYQLVLSDGRVLNAIVAQGFDQEITMVYGMSSDKFDKMLKKLDPNTPSVPYRHAITLANEPNPLLSRWTTWKINFIPLVEPLPRRMMM
jgi:hypothetical protein